MDYSKEQLTEARRQIDSTVHKLRQTVLTLEAKGDPARYKSQLTLARRRIEAFCLPASSSAGNWISWNRPRPANERRALFFRT